MLTQTQSAWLACISVWSVFSAVIVAILTGWVITLKHQVNATFERVAFLEKDYEAREGVHPFVVRNRHQLERTIGRDSLL